MQKLRNRSFYNRKYTLVGAHLPFLTPQSRGSVEDQLADGTFLGSKITSVGFPGVQKIVQITERNWKHDFPKWFQLVFCGHLSFQLLSLSMLCNNYGIVHFTAGNYTLFCVHLPFLTPPKRRLGRGPIDPVDLFGVQNHICAAPWCPKNRTNHWASSKHTSFSNDFGHFFHHLSLQPVSYTHLTLPTKRIV